MRDFFLWIDLLQLIVGCFYFFQCEIKPIHQMVNFCLILIEQKQYSFFLAALWVCIVFQCYNLILKVNSVYSVHFHGYFWVLPSFTQNFELISTRT